MSLEVILWGTLKTKESFKQNKEMIECFILQGHKPVLETADRQGVTDGSRFTIVVRMTCAHYHLQRQEGANSK